MLLSTTKNNTHLSTVERFCITDQECLLEVNKYDMESRRLSLQSRSVYWHIFFITSVITIAIMYGTTFIVVYYKGIPEFPVTSSVYLIPSVDTRDLLIFLSFWSGFYRASFAQTDLVDTSMFIKDYWAFFIFVFILILERLCLMWMENRLGCTDELIKSYEKIEEEFKQVQIEK